MITTKADILAVALKLARVHGLRRVTRAQIAEEAGTATGTISYHFHAMDLLRNAIVAHAVEVEDLPVLSQALAERHPVALVAPIKLRQKAALYLTRN